MHIGSSIVWAPARTEEGARTAETLASSSARYDMRTAKNAALSALNNERSHAALKLLADNPAVSGSPEEPVVSSEAHAVASALAQAADSLATALAQISAMSERRTDRLVNPLVSGLPPFLASDAGSNSGFMIAQYTAAALANENRRLAAPASIDGGITSGLQEDFLAHPTAAANKLLALIDNAEYILAIELMAAAQAHELVGDTARRAAGTDAIHKTVRAVVSPYADDRPLSRDIEALRGLIRSASAPAIP